MNKCILYIYIYLKKLQQLKLLRYMEYMLIYYYNTNIYIYIYSTFVQRPHGSPVSFFFVSPDWCLSVPQLEAVLQKQLAKAEIFLVIDGLAWLHMAHGEQNRRGFNKTWFLHFFHRKTMIIQYNVKHPVEMLMLMFAILRETVDNGFKVACLLLHRRLPCNKPFHTFRIFQRGYLRIVNHQH